MGHDLFQNSLTYVFTRGKLRLITFARNTFNRVTQHETSSMYGTWKIQMELFVIASLSSMIKTG